MHDWIIIGAGIAGASAAFEISAFARVLLLEAEPQPGHHSTGRSAALLTPNYGTPLVRRITGLGAGFLRAPPSGFADGPLVLPRGMVTVAKDTNDPALDALLAASTPDNPVTRISVEEALRLAPVLARDHLAAAVFEPGVMDIDVDALHQAYLRGFRARGGTIHATSRVRAIEHSPKGWTVAVDGASFSANGLLNAAGAWADEVGAMAGAAPIGLVPMRRTAIIVDAPDGVDVKAMPAVEVAGQEPYFKPDAGRIMASLGDETPVVPHDVYPDEMDIALTADWLERHSTVQVRRIQHSWAGLRSFVPDRAPVLGYDSVLPDFLWLAGLGGYGIMMAPALATAAASLVRHKGLGESLKASGLMSEQLSPMREQEPVS